MENKITIPTDNIYKFYALFGLLFFISCIISAVSIHNSSNELAYKNYIERETLKAKENKSQEETNIVTVLERRKQIDKADRDFFVYSLLIGAFFGIVTMVFGFYHWQTKVQPSQDKFLQLQISKLEKEILSLNK